VLVTFLFEYEYDTEALLGLGFDPFTSLLGAISSIMESPGEKYAIYFCIQLFVHHQELVFINVSLPRENIFVPSSPTM
jgi:hypothetical protein